MSIGDSQPFDAHYTKLIRYIDAQIAARLAKFTNAGGQLDLSKAGAVAGKLGRARGGTGNQRGEAAPKDDSVTDAKIPDGAAIDPAKLDQALLNALIEARLVAALVAGPNISLTYNSTTGHLEVAAANGGHAIVVNATPLPTRGTVRFVGAGVSGLDDAAHDTTIIQILGADTPSGAITLGGEPVTLGGEYVTLGG